MSTPLVLLVSRSASRTQNYRQALDRLGISCLAITALKEVPTLVTGTPFSGILLDMPILIRATPSEKLATEDILKALPSAYLNIAPASDSIKLLTATGTQGTAKSLEEFSTICKLFQPRLVRPKDRFPLYLQALLTNGSPVESAEQTVTLNVSPNGSFLLSTNPELQLDQRVSISFIGLKDRSPVHAVICWLLRWGEDGFQAPGIGVRFDSLSEAQRTEINVLLEELKPH